jgi:hypothetical protein
MQKLHPIVLQAAVLGLAVLFIAASSIAVAPPANAGSGCEALLEAAKKGYRGDRTALLACKGAAHAAKARPHALQSQNTRESKKLNRDLRKAYKAATNHDAVTRAKLHGHATARIVAKNVGHAERRRQSVEHSTVKGIMILEAVTGMTIPH